MTLTTDDCNDIRNACYHLAKYWDSLKAVESRHDGLSITVSPIDELATELGFPPDSSVLTEERIRQALQGLQEDED